MALLRFTPCHWVPLIRRFCLYIGWSLLSSNGDYFDICNGECLGSGIEEERS